MPARTGKKPNSQSRPHKRKREHAQVEDLDKAVEELDPKSGTFKNFTDLPLSEPTRAGLKSCRFKTLTDIQARAIPLALKGHDILGAAKTGSGKTLAFVIPVLENLYREQLIGADAGLAAIIISPTRELAIQIFDVLYKVGRQGHMFAAGLVIGGKSLTEEKAALLRMNIVVCTPGRILQHLSQTSFFNVDNLRMLVLDEADRIMDMGFQHDVDAIMEYLPREGRQTMLFSATQTRRVSDLARLSLKDPEYVSVHEAATTATPGSLQQNYIVTPLPDKLDTLWSFIQTAKKAKTVCFLSSGKQVRFIYETFCKLQPGVPLLHLHGRQKQTARLDITQRFAASRYACLFCTDVAARGLDFPAVDWVVQVDCPEDADTYIHRAGRTARFERDGKAVLFLTPSEEPGMLERLTAKRVPIERVSVRQKKQSSIRERLQLMCFQDSGLKYLGQKAFLSYVRSLQLQKDKTIFPADAELPFEEFAISLGLRTAPKIKSINPNQKAMKNRSRQLLEEAVDSENETERPKDKPVRTKYDRMFERKNQDVLTDAYRDLIHSDEEALRNSDGRKEEQKTRKQSDGSDVSSGSDDDDDLLAVKRRIPTSRSPSPSAVSSRQDSQAIQPDGFAQPLVIDSKRRAKMLNSKKALLKYKERGQRLVFDEETGEARPAHSLNDEDTFKAAGKPEEQRKSYVEHQGEMLKKADEVDREVLREKRREKKEKRKAREKAERKAQSGDMSGDDEDEEGEDLLANFVADAQESEEEEVKDKAGRARKWFEEDPEERPGKKAKKKRAEARELQTLEDLEAAAAGLLG